MVAFLVLNVFVPNFCTARKKIKSAGDDDICDGDSLVET